jgi:hypothetical protein
VGGWVGKGGGGGIWGVFYGFFFLRINKQRFIRIYCQTYTNITFYFIILLFFTT